MSKVFFITGASTGIGHATTRQAVAQGHKVAMVARSADKLEALADELGDAVLAIECDVQEPEAQTSAVESALDHFGRIDVVFANAGIGGEPGGFSSAPPESWKQMLLTNVYGLAVTLQATAKAVKKSKGQVIVTSSIAGRRSLTGSMYSASKWAATCIGHGYRKEVAGSGVRVSLIEPGMTDTPFFDEPKTEYLKPDDIARSVMHIVDQPAHVEIHELTVLPIAQTDPELIP